MSDWFDKYDNWDDHLPVGPEPQETELADSLNASYSVFINASLYPCNEGSRYPCNTTVQTYVYPQGNKTQWSNWYNQTSFNETKPVPGTTWPRKLPAGLVFICGNRAWRGIPFWPTGGPCTIGSATRNPSGEKMELLCIFPQQHGRGWGTAESCPVGPSWGVSNYAPPCCLPSSCCRLTNRDQREISTLWRGNSGKDGASFVLTPRGKRVATPWVALCWGQLQCLVRKHLLLLVGCSHCWFLYYCTGKL